MECHGGNGFAEDWGMARLYRQAPLNSIWEGSGHVICLDVLRAMAREPESIAAFMAEVRCHGCCAVPLATGMPVLTVCEPRVQRCCRWASRTAATDGWTA